MTKDPWCRRLAILALVWLVLAIALQVIVSVTFR
jgi:hypothetical protein